MAGAAFVYTPKGGNPLGACFSNSYLTYFVVAMANTPFPSDTLVDALLRAKAKAIQERRNLNRDEMIRICDTVLDELWQKLPAHKRKKAPSTLKLLGEGIPPAPELVAAYSAEIDYPMDGQAWCDHYAAKGWVVSGKTKMKDWRAAVRNWKNNGWKPVVDSIITSQRTVSRAHTVKPATPWELREREKQILTEINKLEAEGREYRGGDQLRPGEYPGFFLKPGYETKIANAKMALRELSRELAGLDKDPS